MVVPQHSRSRVPRRAGASLLAVAGAALGVAAAVAPDLVAQDGGGQDFTRPPGSSDQSPPTTPPAQAPRIRAERVAGGLTAPIFLAEPDDGSGRRFVNDQPGQIRIVDADGELLDEPFLDLSDRIVELDPDYDERGLLGLAFHPDYADNGRFFVYYSAPLRDEAPDDWDHTSHLSELRVSADDPDRADPESERIVMEIDEPYSNHNGGHILFGADGRLYVPLGDGGNGGDVDEQGEDLGRPERGNAQTPDTLLGSVLRIDVDGERPYGVPEDNPFVGADGADEIWAHGLRNPYGLSLDLETGDLWAADAGQALYEEMNLIERGANYGWNIREGLSCFDPEDFLAPPDDCRERGYRGEPLVDPAVTYQRTPEQGSVVVPGVRYRGDEMPEYEGALIFGDYSRIRFISQGVVYVARDDGGEGPWPIERMWVDNTADPRDDGQLDRFLLAIVQGADRELYALTTGSGGPAGSTGEVYALRSAADEGGGWPWWAWVVLAAATVAAGAAALLLGARVRARRERSAG